MRILRAPNLAFILATESQQVPLYIMFQRHRQRLGHSDSHALQLAPFALNLKLEEPVHMFLFW